MFDAMTFARKRGLNKKTNIKAHGFKMKLEGWTDDTVEDIADLAGSQINNVKASLPKLDEVLERTKSCEFKPEDARDFILGVDTEEEKTPKRRGKKQPAADRTEQLNGTTTV